MKPMSAFRFFCLATFGKPASDRSIYKAMRQSKFQSIVEFGLGDGTRAENMIQVAKKFAVTGHVKYTGIDQFEGRDSSQPKLPLREMHKRLSTLEAKVQLVPGDAHSALTRIANSHVRTDLILISAGQDELSLSESWFYFPRMLHAGSLVLIQHQPGSAFQALSRLEIEKRVDQKSAKPHAKVA